VALDSPSSAKGDTRRLQPADEGTKGAPKFACPHSASFRLLPHRARARHGAGDHVARPAANLLGNPIKTVTLLGRAGPALKWQQTSDALAMTAPATKPFAAAIAFKIE
jgi:hypothetical protein